MLKPGTLFVDADDELRIATEVDNGDVTESRTVTAVVDSNGKLALHAGKREQIESEPITIPDAPAKPAEPTKPGDPA